MSYSERMSDGTQTCEVLMDLDGSVGSRCDGCTFRFSVEITSHATQTSQDCIEDLPFFLDEDDGGQRPGWWFEMEADDHVLSFADKPYAYNSHGYEHPATQADEWYVQSMGADYPGTTYTRTFNEFTFGWIDAGNGEDGVTGTLSGRAAMWR